uniref:Paraneoplastic antigen Ma-like C-terminal domain-containing protein n=1 Tax=Anabas testudineus TaxID=64144 RepID=A0AAQ6IIC4_ANATE
MDLCNRFDIDGQRSLYVTGIEGVYADIDIANVFEINGNISKVVKIPNEQNQPEGRALVEYVSEKSISKVDPKILGDIPSPNDPSVVWSVRTIRDVVQEEVGKEIAHRYLSELRAVGGSGKVGFLSVLQSELQESQAPTYHSQTSDIQSSAVQNSPVPEHVMSNDSSTESTEPAQACSAPVSPSLTPVHIDQNMFNPPQVQKVIVEHVIRSESASPTSPHIRIRIFSGRTPRPNGEVDYETWRTQVDLLLCDPALNNAQKVRKILESLLSPAADIVKPLGVNSLPGLYITQLDSAFGVVEDGEELFAAFLSSNQNNGEKPSAYLNRLHSLLTRAISRGGASTENSNELILRQFCRGCWDQSLIIGLQLEHKKNNPPSFPELLLLLRSEEDRRSSKLDRMKKHLGSTKAAAHAHFLYNMSSYDHESVSSPDTGQSET